jgi:hypothetical protein
MLKRTVSPTNTVYIFIDGILGIMDKQVNPNRDGVAGRPLPVRESPLQAKCRFMVRQISKHGMGSRNPVADRRPGMTYKRRRDTELPNFKISTGDFVQE